MEEDEQLDFLNFESTKIIDNDDGSSDITFEDTEGTTVGINADSVAHFDNIATQFDDADLDEIGRIVVDTYRTDLASREEWEDMTIEAVDNLGIEYIETSEPFDGACTATHPLILENSIKFQSKAANELLPAAGPVKTKIVGKLTPEMEARAKRVQRDMNYLVQQEIPEYYEETERALFFTAFLGNAFKRKAYDPERGRITDDFYLPDRIVVNNASKSLLAAERISFKDFISERRMEALIDSGYFLDITTDELGSSYPFESTDFEDRIREIQGISSESKCYDDGYEIVEQQCYLRLNEYNGMLDDDEPAKPYIVVVETASEKVLSIRRNWSESDTNEKPLEWITHYKFVPTAGFYALGYSHLLGNLQRTITLAMRSLADAGQFANLPGGFKFANHRIVDADEPVGFGEFKEIEVPTLVDDIRKVIMPLPFKEPSQTLFALMTELIGVGQKFADSAEQVIAESTNYGPVGTTMALLEASTRFFASVYKRAYNAQAHEFRILARLVFDYLDNDYPYQVDPESQNSRHEDYDPEIIDIIPVSDPNYSSQAQRISKANSIFETAFRTPQVHNMREVVRHLYGTLNVEPELIDQFVVSENKPEKREPMDDILSALKGQPIAAFKGQDHQSHIVTKSAWLQDPANGGSEFLQQVRPIMEANIREHMFMKYAEEVGAIQAQEQLSVEQAAQRISRLNQIALEEQKEGDPAFILAKSEELRAQTAASKENRESQQDQYKLGLDTLEVSLNIIEAQRKAKEAGQEMDMQTVQMGLDLLKTGFEDAKQQNAKPKE